MSESVTHSGRAGAGACCDVDACCDGAYRASVRKDGREMYDETADRRQEGGTKTSCCGSARIGSSACCSKSES